MAHSGLNSEERAAIASDWVNENWQNIQDARLDALERVDGVSEALTDPDAQGDEAIRQKIDGLITAANAVLPEYVADALVQRCAPETEQLRQTLRRLAESIARENLSIYTIALIERYKNSQCGHS